MSEVLSSELIIMYVTCMFYVCYFVHIYNYIYAYTIINMSDTMFMYRLQFFL